MSKGNKSSQRSGSKSFGDRSQRGGRSQSSRGNSRGGRGGRGRGRWCSYLNTNKI